MRNPHDAADALQDAYVAAFRRIGSFRGEARGDDLAAPSGGQRLSGPAPPAADQGRGRNRCRPIRTGPWRWARRPPRDPLEVHENRVDVVTALAPADRRSAGRTGPGRHGGILGRGGGDHPGLCTRHGEEPLCPRSGQTGAAAGPPGAGRVGGRRELMAHPWSWPTTGGCRSRCRRVGLVPCVGLLARSQVVGWLSGGRRPGAVLRGVPRRRLGAHPGVPDGRRRRS